MERCYCGSPDCRQCGPLMGSRKCKIHQEYACEFCEEDAKENDGRLPEPEEGDYE